MALDVAVPDGVPDFDTVAVPDEDDVGVYDPVVDEEGVNELVLDTVLV